MATRREEGHRLPTVELLLEPRGQFLAGEGETGDELGGSTPAGTRATKVDDKDDRLNVLLRKPASSGFTTAPLRWPCSPWDWRAGPNRRAT